jgi:hypothetical protein
MAKETDPHFVTIMTAQRNLYFEALKGRNTLAMGEAHR